MTETLYAQFRDLDRHCVAQKFDPAVCREAVKRKRALIEFHQANPIVRDVVAGRKTFVSIYEIGSRSFRGIRRFIPHRSDPDWNQQLDDLGRIIPNVQHFRRRGLLSVDNPVMCAVYGVAVSVGVTVLTTHAQRDDRALADGSGFANGDGFPLSITLLLLIFGFLFGLFAMLRYRTRNPRQIHAREAAAYMDLNAAYFRANDDEGWATCIQSRGEPPTKRNRRRRKKSRPATA